MISLLSLAAAAIVSIGGPPAPAGMTIVSAGRYTPLYRAAAGGSMAEGSIKVSSFALDRLPVTRARFLSFEQSHPAWRRGVASPAVAGVGYLADWPAALNAGTTLDLQRPVVSVSIAAARAYCAAQNKRLPTTAEWELAAAAPVSDVLGQYATRQSAAPDVVGRGRASSAGVLHLHDRVWEWTSDFDGPAPRAHEHAGHARDARAHAECASAAIGASNTTDYPAFLRNAMRAALTTSSTTRHLGFRCAATLAA